MNSLNIGYRIVTSLAQQRFYSRVNSTNQKKFEFTAVQAVTALRPFYFAVHPDLFGQYPEYRKINENSLKLFNGYLDSLLQSGISVERSPASKQEKLKFYVRPPAEAKMDGPTKHDDFKLIEVNLRQSDILQLVKHVLEVCNLPTSHLPKIITSSSLKSLSEMLSPQRPSDETDDYLKEFLRVKHRQAPEKTMNFQENLVNLVRKSDEASKKYAAYRDDLVRTSENLRQRYGVKRLTWECNWTMQFCPGYLFSLTKILADNVRYANNVNGWSIRFGNGTYVSVDGWLVLGVEDTPEEWCRVLSNLKPSDFYFTDIIKMQRDLSSYVFGATISAFPNESVARYRKWLSILLTNFAHYHQINPNLIEKNEKSVDLSHIRVIITNQYSAQMVDDHGRILIPVSTTCEHSVEFVLGNYHFAAEQQIYRESLHRTAIGRRDHVIDTLRLAGLEWAEHFNLEKISESLDLMMRRQRKLDILKNRTLKFGQSYNVEFDGTIVMPLDWLDEPQDGET